MDFGDLLLLSVELLKHHPEARDRFANRFRYVLVDEFQDTNSVQYELLGHLASGHRNLAVVGDDDQSIYRWRGADVTNILGFTNGYPDATVVKLEQNYRSTAHILTAANSVIGKNRRRHEKKLFTTAGAGSPLGVALLSRGDEEAELIATVIRARLRSGSSPADFAILYRQNAQSRPFEDALRRYRVPYALIGGMAFYERREVKDLVAYLRLVANPSSRQDLERIINVPARGIGKKTVERLIEASERANVSGAEGLALEDAALGEVGLSSAAIKKLREVDRLLADLRALADEAPAAEVARAVIDRTGYLQHLHRTEPVSAEDRILNVQELVSSIADHEQLLEEASGEDAGLLGLAGAKTPLQAFLDEASLVSPDDRTASQEQVSLLTLHAAKGLEFGVVFLVGLEEKTFPTQRAVDSDEPEAMEEERRLCYVGITRAQRELNLTGARYRRIYGREEVRWPSRFLGELPDEVVGRFPAGEECASHPMPTGTTSARAATPVRPAAAPVLPEVDVMSDLPPSVSTDPFAPGSRVHHNTFGVGVIEATDGNGPRAKLKIRFAGMEEPKQVVARFVSLVDES